MSAKTKHQGHANILDGVCHSHFLLCFIPISISAASLQIYSGGGWPENRRLSVESNERSSKETSRRQPRPREIESTHAGEKCSTPSFPKFSKLPRELRLKVWEMAMERVSDQARIVLIYSAKPNPGDDAVSDFISPTPTPPILHACSESRGIALTRFCVLPLSTSQPRSGSGSATGDTSATSSVYLDYSRDVLYFRADLGDRSKDGQSCVYKFVDALPAASLQMIRSIGIDINTAGNYFVSDWIFLARFPVLELFFLGRESSNLDLEDCLSCVALKEEEDMVKFVEDYRENFYTIHQWLSEEKAVEDIVEEIKTDCIWWLYDSELVEFELARKPEVRLVTIENSLAEGDLPGNHSTNRLGLESSTVLQLSHESRRERRHLVGKSLWW